MQKLKISDRKKFIELTEKLPIESIIGMEVETYKGSYSEGINWDFLKYVYNKEKETPEDSAWKDYTVVHKEAISRDSLVSDFDDIQKSGIRGSSSEVTVMYEEEDV